MKRFLGPILGMSLLATMTGCEDPVKKTIAKQKKQIAELEEKLAKAENVQKYLPTKEDDSKYYRLRNLEERTRQKEKYFAVGSKVVVKNHLSGIITSIDNDIYNVRYWNNLTKTYCMGQFFRKEIEPQVVSVHAYDTHANKFRKFRIYDYLMKDDTKTVSSR